MTSTPYGSGPLPDPESGGGRVPEERDWNEGQRTTRRAALLTAAGFGLAGLAAFAMVSSPFAVTLDNAQMARADSARVQPRAVPRAGVRAPRAASDRGRAIPGGYRDARLAAPRDAKLGAAAVQPVDAEAYWHKIVDPMPIEPRRRSRRSASLRPSRGVPRMRMAPCWGLRMPARQSSRVVLPQPLGPTIVSTSPRATRSAGRFSTKALAG